MAVTAKLFDNFPHLLLEDGLAGSILAQDIYVALMSNAYTPSQSAQDYWDDISANEISGTGYDAGGKALASKTCTVTSHTTKFDAADSSWAGTTLTDVRYAVIYYNSGNAATSLLIGYVDFDADYDTVAGTFSITWDTSGIFTITVA